MSDVNIITISTRLLVADAARSEKRAQDLDFGRQWHIKTQ